MVEPKFLELEEVLYLHAESIARFGGSTGVGDLGLVKSALGSAQNTFWYGQGDLFEIAAAYAFHLAQSQAFVDGNKRTGVAAAIAFLRLNGVTVAKDDGSFYGAMIAIAKKQLDKAGLAEVIRRLAAKDDGQ